MKKYPAYALTLTVLMIPMLVAPAQAAQPVMESPPPATPPRAKPSALVCTTPGADGLTYTVLKAGKGEKPGADSKVKVDYKGHLKSDGSQFDAGNGAEFKVGGVIPGFAQGLQLMQAGGTYRLCIPAKLAYGESGAGASIPANTDLVFDVDLLSFTTPPPKPVIPIAERSCGQVTASGLGYTMIKPGSGPAPTDQDNALVDFKTFNAKTGSVMELHEWEKVPLKQTSAVFGEALKMMKKGATYRFCLPTGTTGSESDPLVNVIIDLLDIRIAPLPE